MSRGAAPAAGLLVILALIAAPVAGAAQRYAAPAGSGAACSRAAPCELGVALGGAKSSDEVIVDGGIYATTQPLFVGWPHVYVHGDFGGPPPVIASASESPAILLFAEGGHIAYLDVSNAATEHAGGVVCGAEKGLVERVGVEVAGRYSVALAAIAGCAVRDSLALAAGEGAVGLEASSTGPAGGTVVARNVTAIASGVESIGARALDFESNPSITTLDLRNSILSGQGRDLFAGATGPSRAEIVVGASNFDQAEAGAGGAIVDIGANQIAPPVFANAGAGDYREAAGSPTIDAGVVDSFVGSVDLAGSPRTLGPAPDIGAYEFVPTQLTSLTIKPSVFRAYPAGGPIAIGIKKSRPPVGAAVRFEVTDPGIVAFSVERSLPGRRVGKSCVKPTKGNRSHKGCRRFVAVRGGFEVTADAPGTNRFVFSGRIGGRPLKLGAYRLVGEAGGATLRAPFRIADKARPRRHGHGAG